MLKYICEENKNKYFDTMTQMIVVSVYFVSMRQIIKFIDKISVVGVSTRLSVANSSK